MVTSKLFAAEADARTWAARLEVELDSCLHEGTRWFAPPNDEQ